jgi:hypothetical protein
MVVRARCHGKRGSYGYSSLDDAWVYAFTMEYAYTGGAQCGDVRSQVGGVFACAALLAGIVTSGRPFADRLGDQPEGEGIADCRMPIC